MTVERCNKSIRTLDSYSNEELKKLYKSFTLYIVTEWFKYQKRYKNDYDIKALNVNEESGHNSEIDTRFFNSLRIKTIEMKLKAGIYKDEHEKQQLEYENVSLKTCNEVLFWCAGGFEELEKSYEEGKLVQNPDELYEELHLNDDFDEGYGRATKIDIYTFIWETLRFLDVRQLGELCKLADRKFEFRNAHRPSKNLKIYKYNKDNNLIETFENRADCIKKENISKSSLSNVLSGRRKYLNGYKYVEETEN